MDLIKQEWEIEMEGWDDGSRPAICQIELNSVLGWISFKNIAFWRIYG